MKDSHNIDEEALIKQFFIKGLFGERDVEINFSSNLKILIAENGYGKTSILKAFYALLSGDLFKLRKIKFDEIGVVTKKNEKISFEKTALHFKFSKMDHSLAYERLETEFSEDEIYTLLDDFSSPKWSLKNSTLFKRVRKRSRLSPSMLHHSLQMLSEESEHSKPFREVRKDLNRIRKLFNYDLLYLPTYRRVEEDLRDLNIYNFVPDEVPTANSEINFGMNDVALSIDKITNEIKDSTSEGYQKTNGKMLSQLANDKKANRSMHASIMNNKNIDVVLARVGEKNLSVHDRDKIKNLIKSGEIKNNHESLVYFLSELIEIYESQAENDKAIHEFVKICNNYLTDKKFYYDESSISLDILREKNQNIVDLEQLSSGEKQIISLFALLYLGKKENIAIFFDEPELSLSLEWQKTILVDIVNSQKCKFLFATTHSPFIFENELIKHTVSLSEYITEIV